MISFKSEYSLKFPQIFLSTSPDESFFSNSICLSIKFCTLSIGHLFNFYKFVAFSSTKVTILLIISFVITFSVSKPFKYNM